MQRRMVMGTAAILALLVWPARALASLDGSGGASAGARFTGNDAEATIMSFPDHVSVTLFSSANETYTPEFGPWLDDFEYEATIIGTGTVTYGSAVAEIQTDASAVPEFVDPAPGNPSARVYNQYASEVTAVLSLDFEEDGVVTGAAPGAPVTLTFNFLIESLATLVGGHLSFPRYAQAQFNGRIIDQTVGFGSVERTAYGNELVTADLATAVGHVLSIEGHLVLSVEGLAGGSTVVGFVPQFLGSVDATHTAGLWISAPGGVGIDAPSGHDYTIPVPEPGRALLLLLGAGTLLTSRPGRPHA